MCLYLTTNIEKQIATEDIVCYKRVINDLTQYKNKSFTGIINTIQVEGKIQVEGNYVYFCTNNPRLNGMDCEDKLGFSYSWEYDVKVESIIINDVNIIMSNKDLTFMTPYQNAKVQVGKTYTSKLIHASNFTIEDGLHSFATYEDAKNDGFGIVVKCIIPKGAEYYLGNFDNKPSYASNEIKYLEIITK